MLKSFEGHDLNNMSKSSEKGPKQEFYLFLNCNSVTNNYNIS